MAARSSPPVTIRLGPRERHVGRGGDGSLESHQRRRILVGAVLVDEDEPRLGQLDAGQHLRAGQSAGQLRQVALEIGLF